MNDRQQGGGGYRIEDRARDQRIFDERGNPIGEPIEGQEGAPSRYGGIISWVVSGAMHATILLLMMAIVFITKAADEETPPVKITTIPPPPDRVKEKPKLDRDILDPKVVLDLAVTANEVAPINPIDVPVERSEHQTEIESDVPKGREEAVAEIETGSNGAFMAPGAGAGSAGMLGNRTGNGRRRAVGRGGGSRGSENAVDAALRWFKKHQSPNGMWDGENYFQNCAEDPKCEPGGTHGLPVEQINPALTGYALLTFLGAGFDHKTPNKFQPTVKKGIEYLLAIQKADGMIGERNYEHPIAAMALAEAYTMTADADLRGPAQRAIDQIIKHQNQDGTGKDAAYAGLGWDYTNPSGRNDASVTGWNVMALKSAYAGGLSIGNSMEGAKQYLERAWKAANTRKEWCQDWAKLDPYKDISRFPYVWSTGSAEDVEIGGWDAARNSPQASFEADAVHKDMAPVGMVLAVFLGHAQGDPMLETLANYVMKYQTPKAYPTNTYYMYYNTLGIFQVGGEKWKTWNSVVRDMLVNAQRKGDDCFDGSWDPMNTAFAGHDIGRVLSTSYNTLCLEVYYRYAQMLAAGAAHK